MPIPDMDEGLLSAIREFPFPVAELSDAVTREEVEVPAANLGISRSPCGCMHRPTGAGRCPA